MAQSWFRHLLALTLLAGTTGNAAAATSAWAETEGGRVRLVVLPASPEGEMRAMLDIQLDDGWKTYWRDPGESGIPPSVVISEESGVSLEKIGFPVPKHFDDGVTRYTGYDQSVGLPMTLKFGPNASGKVVASVFLGICSDICIPLQAELTVDTGGETFTNPLEETAVAAAEERLPGPARDGFRPLSAAWSEDAKSLRISFEAPGNDGVPPEVFLSANGIQFGVAETVPTTDGAFTATVPVIYKPKSADLAQTEVLLTARSGEETMESPLVID